MDENPTNECEEFLNLFMSTRDLFIRQLVDRYPSNYHDVEVQIQKLKHIQQGECITYMERNYLINILLESH